MYNQHMHHQHMHHQNRIHVQLNVLVRHLHRRPLLSGQQLEHQSDGATDQTVVGGDALGDALGPFHGVGLASACLAIDEDRPVDSFKSCKCHLLHGLFIHVPIRISVTVYSVVVEFVLQLLFGSCRGTAGIGTLMW